MSRYKTIIVEIDESGNCSIEGEGFVGPECVHFIEEIENHIGETISQEDKTESRQGTCNRQIRNRTTR